MNINVRKQDDITILDLLGTLVLGEAVVTFRDQIQELVGAGVKRVVVNLTGVQFVDSSGIGAMVGAHTSLEISGGVCKFCSPLPRVVQTLKLTHMLEVFDIHEMESSAVASFGAGS